MAAEGGIMSLVEAEGGNEKTLISDAIAAIESGAEDEAAAVALAKFVQVHGEDALRDLVEKVQSGDYADTRERFANGENGIVNGPGEMADADYGYVGVGKGKINLYKEKTVVKKNVSEDEAVNELINLIKEYGDWVEENS